MIIERLVSFDWMGVGHPSRDPDTLRVMKLEFAASACIRARAIYRVLSFLIETPAFSFKTYDHNDHNLFKSPMPVHQLPVRRDHIACQHMLNAVHIEEASYEGNDRVLKEWWRQLEVNTPEKQKKMGEDDLIVWAGDQLTVSHIRGLHRFRAEDLNSYDCLAFVKELPGWFHAQIALEHSLHSQYYGMHYKNMYYLFRVRLHHVMDGLHPASQNSPDIL